MFRNRLFTRALSTSFYALNKRPTRRFFSATKDIDLWHVKDLLMRAITAHGDLVQKFHTFKGLHVENALHLSGLKYRIEQANRAAFFKILEDESVLEFMRARYGLNLAVSANPREITLRSLSAALTTSPGTDMELVAEAAQDMQKYTFEPFKSLPTKIKPEF